MSLTDFKTAYKNLNKEQKQAVDTIEGPVMVVAGPGTGKTQVLATRIANIMLQSGTEADSILCLTFTNSGVRAMRERLFSLVGKDASRIKIATFHSFASSVVDEYFEVLDFDRPPRVMDEAEAVALADEILENGEFKYLCPRGDSSRYFRDIKSLISILKREGIGPEDFESSIDTEINFLQNDESSISTRGESKGKLKKEVEGKIAGLARTKEIVEFFREYERLKLERLICDYDDVLKYALQIFQESDTARADTYEKYLYVLVDEHQDSSGVQNEILKAIWGQEEKPNIFVVGDDRQLIYGFGGASIEYFKGFKNLFGKAKVITLTENYRSTQAILDSADKLLASKLTLSKLKSNHKEMHKIGLFECMYPRDEILLCAKEIKEKIDAGVDPSDCAILVPKNYQVRNAVEILRDQGLPVASAGSLSLFDTRDAQVFISILKVINDPFDGKALTDLLFDPFFKIDPLLAHKFIRNADVYNLSIEDLSKSSGGNLLSGLDPIANLGTTLGELLSYSRDASVYETVQYIGEKLFLDQALDHDTLIRRVEVVRTFLHLVLLTFEKFQRGKKVFKIGDFLEFINRMQDYGEDLPLAVFAGNRGIKVLTMHSSKGLEFDFVWIAHASERNLMSRKPYGFAIPSDIAEHLEEKDEEVVKRQVYVALTRAKRFCNFSYARNNFSGTEDELAHIIAELPENIFDRHSAEETEDMIMQGALGPRAYVVSQKIVQDKFSLADLQALVAEDYKKLKVSVTMLNNFFECPWKWYFRSLLRLPDVMSESLVFGNIVHASIEKILNDTNEDLADIVDAELKKQNIYEPTEHKRLKREALATLELWIENRLPKIEKYHESERFVSYIDKKFPHLLLHGQIDLIEKFKDGTLRVTDFKTGSVKTKNEIEKHDEGGRLSNLMRQLAMYSYLLASVKGEGEVAESQLEFLEAKTGAKDAIYKTTITSEDVDLLVRDIEHYDSMLSSGEWVNMPCHFKAYGKQKDCPNCKRAEIYKS